MRDLLPCPPCGRQGRPGKGFLAGFIERPRGSAPRERDHRGGDHPVPSRTRQLSPPSPRVLQRQAAGGQGVALAEGAFLSAPRRPAGGVPLRAFPRLGRVFAWRSFNLNAAILVSRYRRPIRALEALARSALCGFLSRARRLLTARAAIHLPAASGSWPPDRPSVAHGGSPCGISLQFDDALTVALALFRVRLARWVLARLCSFVLTP